MAMPNFWIEKTLVKGRKDRQIGEHSLGKAMWSPKYGKTKSGKQGADIYKNMRLVSVCP